MLAFAALMLMLSLVVTVVVQMVVSLTAKEVLLVLDRLRSSRSLDAEARKIVARLDGRFDSAKSHAGERFKLHARWITAGAAVLMSVILQIGGAAILRELWRDQALTAQLLVEADPVRELYDQLTAIESESRDLEAQAELADSVRSRLLGSDLKGFHAFGAEDYL